MKNNLTLRYSGVQGLYYAARGVLIAFGAVYLQGKGVSAAMTGIIMALSTVIPALLLPFLADAADRTQRLSLRVFIAAMGFGLLVVLLFILGIRLKGSPLLLAYLLVLILIQMPEAMLNAVADYFFRHKWPVNFGVSRSMGSLSFALSSLLMGYLINWHGVNMIPAMALLFTAGCMICLFLLPKMPPDHADADRAQAETSVSLLQFLKKYPRYTTIMIGFFCTAVFHVMTETYLINMMERIGGDSASVGTALMIANVAEFVVVFNFDRLRRLMRASSWMILTAILFAVKAVLFHLAWSVPVMFVFQAMQSVNYGIFAPGVVYFANEEVDGADSVKGQSVFMAVFTLGGSLGNLLGGLILQGWNVRMMTLAGIAFAVAGAVICLFTLAGPKRSRR